MGRTTTLTLPKRPRYALASPIRPSCDRWRPRVIVPACLATSSSYSARDTLAVRYAHAIPNKDALDALVELAPLVELGAGTGYWAWLLRRRGVDILAFDTCPPIDAGHDNLYHRNADAVGTCWTTVQPGGPEQAVAFPDRTLFLCWPPQTNMAEQALQQYLGQCLALVGTRQSSITTATPPFYAALREQFALQAIVPIPQWHGIDDRLTVWVRR